MAIQLIKQNSKFNNLHQHFYIDNLSDLDSIENEYKCQMGDVAELPDGMQYQRHSDDYQGQKWEYWQGGGTSGSELPEVDSGDNGKVLTVIEGEWGKGVPSGGNNNEFVINLTWDDNAEGYVSDKTIGEFITAVNNGQAVSAVIEWYGKTYSVDTLWTDGTPDVEGYIYGVKIAFIGVGYYAPLTSEFELPIDSTAYMIFSEGKTTVLGNHIIQLYFDKNNTLVATGDEIAKDIYDWYISDVSQINFRILQYNSSPRRIKPCSIVSVNYSYTVENHVEVMTALNITIRDNATDEIYETGELESTDPITFTKVTNP